MRASTSGFDELPGVLRKKRNNVADGGFFAVSTPEAWLCLVVELI